MIDYTIDELMSACIARQVVDGEVLGQGINTPMVMAGFILAKCTHAPQCSLRLGHRPIHLPGLGTTGRGANRGVMVGQVADARRIRHCRRRPAACL